MSIRLIVNADDYGRDDDVSRGIRQAHSQGIVTSTTAMLNFPANQANLRLAAKEAPGLGLGVHLVLTSGKPLLAAGEIPSLVDENGAFLRPDKFWSKLDSLNSEEVMAEWRAQIDRFIRIMGHPPTHLDSHHHSSYYNAMLFRNMLLLAKEYGCAVRIPVINTAREDNGLYPSLRDSFIEFSGTLLAEFRPRAPQRFIATFYDEQATKSTLVEILRNLEEGVSELMCHPGYAGKELIATSIYNHERERELEILTDPEISDLIKKRNIQLISFAGLADG